MGLSNMSLSMSPTSPVAESNCQFGTPTLNTPAIPRYPAATPTENFLGVYERHARPSGHPLGKPAALQCPAIPVLSALSSISNVTNAGRVSNVQLSVHSAVWVAG